MKKTVVLIVLLLSFFLFTGCATYRPVTDMKGVDNAKYEQDLRECQAYADQISPAKSTAAGAAIGATAGAVMGAIIGSFVGEAKRGAVIGASAAGAQGAMTGAAAGAKSQIDIIKNCMVGRGYKVLQ